MNDKAKTIVFLNLAVMSLVAIVALAWKRPDLTDLVAFDGSKAWRQLFGQVVVIIFCPVWMGLGWSIAQWRLATVIPRPSEDYRRWTEASLVVSGLALLVMQLWTARNFVADESLGREAMLRGITLFIGAVTAAQGNFLGKVRPPSGDGAPAPGVWSRVALRMGWAMAVTGLGVMVCAIVLQMPALFFVPVAAMLMLLANAVLSRQALRAEH